MCAVSRARPSLRAPSPGFRPLAQFVVASALGACAASSTSPTASAAPSGEEGRLVGIVDAHNRARQNATPAPSAPLAPLSWSAEAAATASAWAEHCSFAHNPELGKLGMGQNLYASVGLSPSAADVVEAWASEVSDYDYATNTCKSGKMCGHYTQIVWSTTTAVGCAIKSCTDNSPFDVPGAWELWVCDYSPPGNYRGKRPY